MTNRLEFYARFQSNERMYRNGAVQERQCRDICCLIAFFVMLGAFIAIGSFYIGVSTEAFNEELSPQISSTLTAIQRIWYLFWPILLGVVGLAILLSITFLCLLKNCTSCMVYSIAVFAFLTLIAIIAISIVYKLWGIAIGFGIALLLLSCFLFCCRNHVEKGIILVKIAIEFLTVSPIAYLISLVVSIMALSFLVFWSISLYCIQFQAGISKQNNESRVKEVLFFAYWIFMVYFITIFFYYAMLFLLATACSSWFYGEEKNALCSGLYFLNRAHIGSLTFASFLISFVKIFRCTTEFEGDEGNVATNACTSMWTCCFSCCLAEIQALVDVLNGYAVIAMTITGQGYIDSSKTAAGIIYQDFGLFFSSSIISLLIEVTGIIVVAGLPTILGFAIFSVGYQTEETEYKYSIIIVMLFFLCSAVAIFFTSLIGEIVSCIYIFYSFDRRQREIGITIQNVPELIRSIDDSFEPPEPGKLPAKSPSANRFSADPETFM